MDAITMMRGALGMVVAGVLALVAMPVSARAAAAEERSDRIVTQLSIASDPGVTLAGTLRIPTAHGSGPVPLAIVIPGHGRNGRGGYDVIIDRLLAGGIATLEYDKRGVGGSTGAYEEDTVKMTRDVAAVVAAMRARRQIDGGRIALIGHSQGAPIAVRIAAADRRIAAIVLLAGPVGDGLDLFRRMMCEQLLAAGKLEATVAPLVEHAVALIGARRDHAGATTIADLRAGVIDGFFANGFTREQAVGALAAIDRDEVYEIADMRIATELRALRIPVLAVFGALDPLVPAAGNTAAAREALADNPAGKVALFDGLSHWLKEGAKTGSEQENAALGPNAGSPRVVTLVGDWLTAALTPAP